MINAIYNIIGIAHNRTVEADPKHEQDSWRVQRKLEAIRPSVETAERLAVEEEIRCLEIGGGKKSQTIVRSLWQQGRSYETEEYL